MVHSKLTVPGTDALPWLDELRGAFGRTGEYPLLLGANAACGRLFGHRSAHASGSAAAPLGPREDPERWLAARADAFEARHGDPERLLGVWPRERPLPWAPALHRDLSTGRPLQRVHIGLVRIETPWELPLAFRYGGWGDCPTTSEHCAVHRLWFERFGAEITGMSTDVIECRVTRPPTDRASAMALARAQYGYCPGIVELGIGCLWELAAMLLDAEHWCFWWE